MKTKVFSKENIEKSTYMIPELQVTGTSARAQDSVSSPFSSCLSTFLGERFFFTIVVIVGARGAVVIVFVVVVFVVVVVDVVVVVFVLAALSGNVPVVVISLVF